MPSKSAVSFTSINNCYFILHSVSYLFLQTIVGIWTFEEIQAQEVKWLSWGHLTKQLAEWGPVQVTVSPEPPSWAFSFWIRLTWSGHENGETPNNNELPSCERLFESCLWGLKLLLLYQAKIQLTRTLEESQKFFRKSKLHPKKQRNCVKQEP